MWENVPQELVKKANAPLNRTNIHAVFDAIEDCHMLQAAHDNPNSYILHSLAFVSPIKRVRHIMGIMPNTWDKSIVRLT